MSVTKEVIRMDGEPRKKVYRLVVKILCWISILWGAFQLMGGLVVNVFCLFTASDVLFSATKAVSVGIIGGADGPTTVLVSSLAWTAYIAPIAACVIGILGLVWLKRERKG